LDLARRRDGQTLIVPMRLFAHWDKLRLAVPQLVIDEFDRNRPSAESRVTRSVSDRFREVRRDLQDYGGERASDWISEMTHQIPMLSATTLQNFREIRELLENAERIEPGPTELERVIQRGVSKRAPFHLNKNSVADALLVELFATLCQNSDSAAFVTSNHSDFSNPGGDRREPHPDIANLFDSEKVRYGLGVDGLRQILLDELGAEFQEEVDEIEFLAHHDQPRTYGEIFEAAEEYFDKVWYIRHLIHLEKEMRGEIEPIGSKLRETAEAAAERIRERYGPENVGPWDDWEWGYVNGKLATLRWVLGSEWDFLDT
jgi:hypothetical protein